MTTFDGIAGRFLALHSGDRPLLQPNAWDAGSARILASMGFEAIATTSSGFAATLGRADGRVTRDAALAHAAALPPAVDVPAAAHTEHGRTEERRGGQGVVGGCGARGARYRLQKHDSSTKE